jgi:hypothetical protein
MSLPFPRTGACNLDKFGVELSGTRGPLLQPRVQYRFRVLFFGFGSREGVAEALTLNTNTVTIPNLSFETQEINSYNSRAYFAGKHTWGTASLQVRDTYDDSVSRAVGAQLQRQLDHYNQTGFQSASDYKFKMVIQQLSGGTSADDVNQNIHLCGCFLEDVTYDGFDYASSAMRNIEMTIRPDNVIIESGNSGEEFTVFANPGVDPRTSAINL